MGTSEKTHCERRRHTLLPNIPIVFVHHDLLYIREKYGENIQSAELALAFNNLSEPHIFIPDTKVKKVLSVVHFTDICKQVRNRILTK